MVDARSVIRQTSLKIRMGSITGSGEGSKFGREVPTQDQAHGQIVTVIFVPTVDTLRISFSIKNDYKKFKPNGLRLYNNYSSTKRPLLRYECRLTPARVS